MLNDEMEQLRAEGLALLLIIFLVGATLAGVATLVFWAVV